MSAVEALRAARAAGLELGIDGDGLVLEASAAPPAAVLDMLSRHKAGVIALLRLDRQGWSSEDWRAHFDERAGIAECDGGQTREQAEAMAFECCVVEWMKRHPCRSDPGCCAACGEPDRVGHTVVPFRTESHAHAWLHPECWKDWHRERLGRAKRALAAIGLPGIPGQTEGFLHVE